MKTYGHFPVHPTDEYDHDNGDKRIGQIPGLTKRELFAAMAMEGLCANHAFESASFEVVADYAVKQADALIERLNKP